MPVGIKIIGPDGNTPLITQYGELVVAPISYNIASTVSLIADDTGLVLVPPIMGKRIVVTGIILSGSKSISTTDAADVEVYESTTGIGEDVATSLLLADVGRSQTPPIPPMNVITSEGTWVMAKTSDETVKVTVYCYYI